MLLEVKSGFTVEVDVARLVMGLSRGNDQEPSVLIMSRAVFLC